MSPRDHANRMNRREFMKTTAAAAVAGGALMAQGPARGANRFPKGADGLDHRNERPDRMQYRQLGKTKFMCSRLVFGCGAALAGGKAVRLLGRAYDQGVNFFDVGYDDYYKGSERHLAAFLKAHRDEVWVTSKAPARVTAEGPLTANGARGAAKYWTGQLDLSLGRLELDYVDAYYFMGVSDPELVRSDELASAFAAARDAGKVGHAGISTHENAQECLEAAIEADYFSIAMIAICPAGWYDYRTKELLNNKGTLKQLRLVLDRARDAGIGLMAMKAARPIATVPYGGKYGRVADDTIMTAFDRFYDERLMNASLSPYQRSYAYVLENGLDVVNSDMQNFAHFEENLIAARDSRLYLA